MCLHHFVSVVPPLLTSGDATHLFVDHHVELFALLLLHMLLHLTQLRCWSVDSRGRVEATHRVGEGLLVLATVPAGDALLR